ncbi:MAG TPA: ABC-2 family transporter protein [Bacilli bacterium]|nr:ABC-2 family transporter protein [Bacilli bacterium]
MFKRYKPFLRASAMDLAVYRFNLIIWLLVTVLQMVCMVFLWFSVYRSSAGGINTIINGFNYKEMIVYTVFTTIFTFVTFNNETLWLIYSDIRKGTIGNYLIKPISYRGKFIAGAIGGYLIMTLMFGLPLFAISYTVFGLIGFITIPTWYDLVFHILLFLVAQFLAVLLNDTITYIFGLFCFYTSSGWGLNSLRATLTSFFSGTLLPLAFFPPVFKDIVNWMPFAGLSQNPILILLLKYDYLSCLKVLGLSIAWIIVLELLAKLIFHNGIKKVTVQGG